MNDLERKLIELNDLLHKVRYPPAYTTPVMIQAAQVAQSLRTPDNDTIIINAEGDQCHECPQGYTGSQGLTGYTGSAGITGFDGSRGYSGSQGYTGSQGQDGPAGIPGTPGQSGPVGFTGSAGNCSCECNAILVDSNYTAQQDDYYIGVNSTGPTTISLPANCTNCQELIVKAEMGPPLGNRKITVKTTDGSNIDGASTYVIEVPYQSVNLLCRGGNWYII